MKKGNVFIRQDRIRIKYFFFFLMLIIFLYFLKVSPSVFLISSGVTGTILFGWMIYKEYKEATVKITPVLVLFIIPFLMLGISSVYQGFEFLTQEYVRVSSQYTTTTSVVMGYIMVAVGLFFQFLGIIYFRPKPKKKLNYFEIKSKLRLLPQFIFFLVLSKFTEINFTLGVLQTFLNSLPLSILIFIALKDRKNILTSYSYKRNCVIAGSLILFIISAFSLSKTIMSFSLVPIPLFYLMHTEKYQKYKIAVFGIGFAITYFLFIQPLVSSARVVLSPDPQEVSVGSISDFILSGEYKYLSINANNRDYNQMEVFLNRIFEVNAPAYIYDLTKTYGFRNGETFNKMIYALIPRIIWKDKPKITQSNEFATEFFNQSRNNIGMLISGELYWNFGILGIVFGSLILGLCIGYLWMIITPFAFKNFIYFTVYFNLLQTCFGGSEFSSVLMKIIQLIIIFLIIYFINDFKTKKEMISPV